VKPKLHAPTGAEHRQPRFVVQSACLPTCVVRRGRAATFSSVPPRCQDDLSECVLPAARRDVLVERSPSRRCSIDESVVFSHHRWCQNSLSFHGLYSPPRCSRCPTCLLALTSCSTEAEACRFPDMQQGLSPTRSPSPTVTMCWPCKRASYPDECRCTRSPEGDRSTARKRTSHLPEICCKQLHPNARRDSPLASVGSFQATLSHLLEV
jgi:hypothetical protein